MNTPDFPRDPAKFKPWADEACRTWPPELTALAYNAHLWPDEYMDRFAAAFRKSQEAA